MNVADIMGVNFHVNSLSLFMSLLSVDVSNSDTALLKQDENRYNASRGAHLNLKRAEKARILVNKIPGMC
jgi:hypothetical protein